MYLIEKFPKTKISTLNTIFICSRGVLTLYYNVSHWKNFKLCSRSFSKSVGSTFQRKYYNLLNSGIICRMCVKGVRNYSILITKALRKREKSKRISCVVSKITIWSKYKSIIEFYEATLDTKTILNTVLFRIFWSTRKS